MSGVRGQVSGVRCHMSYDRKKYYVRVHENFPDTHQKFLAIRNFLVAYALKNIHLHKKKIWTHAEKFETSAGYIQKSGNFLTNARNFWTHAGNFMQIGHLLCHVKKQTKIIYCTIKVSGHVL